MNMRNVRPFLSALAVVLLAGSVARAQSLGELAAKEKERREAARQKNGGATKVITEDDLRGGGKGTFSNAGSTAATAEAAKDAPAADGSKPAGKEKTEDEIKAEQQAAWRKRLDDANAQVVSLSTRANELQAAVNDMTGNLYSTGRTNALNDLEKAKADLAAAQQTVADLEEEGRRNRFR